MKLGLAGLTAAKTCPRENDAAESLSPELAAAGSCWQLAAGLFLSNLAALELGSGDVGQVGRHVGRHGRSHLVQHCTRHFPLRSLGQELQSQEGSLAQCCAPTSYSVSVANDMSSLSLGQNLFAQDTNLLRTHLKQCDVLRQKAPCFTTEKRWAFCPTANTSSAALKLLAASN